MVECIGRRKARSKLTALTHSFEQTRHWHSAIIFFRMIGVIARQGDVVGAVFAHKFALGIARGADDFGGDAHGDSGRRARRCRG